MESPRGSKGSGGGGGGFKYKWLVHKTVKCHNGALFIYKVHVPSHQDEDDYGDYQ